MVCRSIRYTRLTFNTFCFHCVIGVYFYSVHACTFNKVINFLCTKISPVHLSLLRPPIKWWYDHFQFLGYTKAYETLLRWRKCLNCCVHLGYQMSSNHTVKLVWYFLRGFKSRLSMGLLNRGLIISVLIHRFNSRCSSSLLYDLWRLPCATPNNVASAQFPKPKHCM